MPLKVQATLKVEIFAMSYRLAIFLVLIFANFCEIDFHNLIKWEEFAGEIFANSQKFKKNLEIIFLEEYVLDIFFKNKVKNKNENTNLVFQYKNLNNLKSYTVYPYLEKEKKR